MHTVQLNHGNCVGYSSLSSLFCTVVARQAAPFAHHWCSIAAMGQLCFQ